MNFWGMKLIAKIILFQFTENERQKLYLRPNFFYIYFNNKKTDKSSATTTFEILSWAVTRKEAKEYTCKPIQFLSLDRFEHIADYSCGDVKWY